MAFGQPAITGQFIYKPTNTVVATSIGGGGSSRCEDVSDGTLDDHPLFITRRYADSIGLIKGEGANYKTPASGYPYDGNPMSSIAHATLGSSPPSNVIALTDVASRTNPSRPEVSVPNFLWELGDIPKKLFERGLRLSKRKPRDGETIDSALDTNNRDGNDSVAEFNFGWDLAFRDLFKLISFSSYIDKRIAETQGAFDKGGLSRSRTVWHDEVSSSTPNVLLQSAIVTVIGTRTKSTTSRMWGSVRWKPTVPTPPSAAELRSTMQLAVHGWNLSPATVWEALPWSWFIDYFYNVGDYLNATRNAVGLAASTGCVMQHTRTVWTDKITSVSPSPQYTASGYRVVLETKSRTPTPIGIDARVPFVSGKQLVTLLSIAHNLGYSGMV
jgi:hypothetical protein